MTSNAQSVERIRFVYFYRHKLQYFCTVYAIFHIEHISKIHLMKQKYLLLAAAFSFAIMIVIAIGWMRYSQVQPISVQDPASKTPIVTYNSPNNSSRPTMTEEDKKQADAPGEKQPTITPPNTNTTAPSRNTISNSPKQDEVRQSIKDEYTYYPLLTSNDPGYAANWAVQKVNAPAAWNTATGNGKTVVAVVDTGFALNHEDLKNNWFTNAGESGNTQLGDRCWTGLADNKTTNACDDDNNGYIDDWRGWNFSGGDNNPTTGRTNPAGVAVAHGTEVAGLVGAAGNNATGIVTINWNTKVMPLQVLSDDGPGYTSDVAAAIYYAVDNGADVINLSLGGGIFDPALKEATDYAYVNKVVVVAAAGNCGTGNESGCQNYPAGSISYPALNDHVIAVGATTVNDQRASFSSYGPALDVVAPGSGTIVSPTWTSSNDTTLYSGALYGTSYASPQVASLASLIKSIRPSSSVDDITALLSASTTKLPIMNGSIYTNELGHGVINAESALTVAQSLNATSAVPKLLQAGGPVSEHRYSATDTLGSGCTTNAAGYCTVWMRNAYNGHERYLPYQAVNTQLITGWTWSGSMLQSGEWQIRAVQGDSRSSVYSLSNK
ncbi:MAG: peptidase and in kexin sedolisin [Candidatus Saccharibacteria bacterium]|nr:peptidase and in kexin sedolisin [Candidatus Saccharibacteria bacterium]